MKILSCNILIDRLSPKKHPWESRRSTCIDTITNENADIICHQEMSYAQHLEFKNALPDHTAIDTNINTNNDPLNCIWYKTNKFEQTQVFHLSLPNSLKQQDSPKRLRRYLNGIKLLDIASNQEFVILNTHLNYECEELVLLQTKNIINYINTTFTQVTKIILAGDMNHEHDSNIMQKYFAANLSDSYKDKHGNSYPGPSFHSFKSSYKKQSKVDWILTKNLSKQIINSTVLDNIAPENCGSDHFFISAEIKL